MFVCSLLFIFYFFAAQHFEISPERLLGLLRAILIRSLFVVVVVLEGRMEEDT